MTDTSATDTNPLPSEDQALLAAVRTGNDWLRAVLCTLARRGVAFRTEYPARARGLLDALAPYPVYKAGQFLFDLMEWEDFMLDGPLPPALPTTLDARSLQRLAHFLGAIKTHLDGAVLPVEVAIDPSAFLPHPDEDLPPLEGGFYLYPDVVLGLLRSVAPLFKTEEG